MKFRRIHLQNWRNFIDADIIDIGDRLFITGPNACGKSNLLDAFRFLRDIAKTGGGFQQALQDRGGLSKVRCLAARRYPDVRIEVELSTGANGDLSNWRYALSFRQQNSGKRRMLLSEEKVWRNNKIILSRPDAQDKQDELRLTQTHLEQINANQQFRPIADEFQKIVYLHLVPQLLKYRSLANRESRTEDPFGVKFLERIQETPEPTRASRLRKIEKALQIAVPGLSNLTQSRDEKGDPHLEAVYRHWRPNAGRQREDQFSDGTLRLIGLLWALLDGDSLLLLEEPELSLHTEIVKKLPALIWRLQRKRSRQVILSTHSTEIFLDKGIRPKEVVLLQPHGSEGTTVRLAADLVEVKTLLENRLSLAEIIPPLTAPENSEQLSLFE
jgi:predicted ATPase